MKKVFKPILFIIGIYLILILTSHGYPLFIKKALHIDTNDDVPDTNVYSHVIPSDYIKVLKLKKACCSDSDTSKLYFTNSVIFKLRNPVSSFIYNRNYTLQVYKISSDWKQPLTKNIDEKYINAKKTTNISNFLFVEKDISYLYKASLPLQASNVYLTLDGKNNRTIIKNDSVICYYSMLNNFSIQYSQTGAHDIFGERGYMIVLVIKRMIQYFQIPILIISRLKCFF